MHNNLYDILGVSKSSNQDEIRKAYREIMKRIHPDHNADKYDSDEFNNVKQAYDILSDSNKRANYDSTGYIEIEENQLYQSVYGLLREQINNFLNYGDRIFEMNIIADMSTYFKSETNKLKISIMEYKKKKKFLHRVIKKIRKKNKTKNSDMIGNILREQETQLNQVINSTLDRIRVLNKADEVVNDYEFDFTKYLDQGD